MSDTPCVFVVGMDTPADATDDELVQFNRHYDELHVPEILENNPRFTRGTRYRLLQPDPRNDLGPAWLTLYEIENEQAAMDFFAATSGTGGTTQHYTEGPPVWTRKTITWRVLWRSLDREGFRVPPETTLTIGLETKPSERGVRFERAHVLDFPGDACPPYCVFYDGATDPQAESDPTWRLVYERIGGSSRAQ